MIEPMGQTRPLERRWGGWYVTGNLGSFPHFGNVDVATLTSGDAPPAPTTVMSLEQSFDTRGYLTPYSDIAALMVFEHQMQMTNLLTRLSWETRVAVHEKRSVASSSAFRDRVAEVVDYMVFVLWTILSGKNKDVRYRHFSPADRRAVLEIVRETKTDLPQYFLG